MEKKRGLQRSLQGRHRLDRSVFRNVWGNVCSEAQVTPVCAHTCSEETQEFSANELDAEIYDHGVKRPTKPGLFRKVSEPPQSRWREIEASPLPHFITQVPESFAELTRERLLRGCIPALHGRGSSRGTLQCPSCRGKVYTRRVLLPWTPIFSIHMTSKKLKYLHKKGPRLLRVSSVDWYHDQGNTGGGCFTDFLSHPFTCPPASFVFLFFFSTHLTLDLIVITKADLSDCKVSVSNQPWLAVITMQWMYFRIVAGKINKHTQQHHAFCQTSSRGFSTCTLQGCTPHLHLSYTTDLRKTGQN